MKNLFKSGKSFKFRNGRYYAYNSSTFYMPSQHIEIPEVLTEEHLAELWRVHREIYGYWSEDAEQAICSHYGFTWARWDRETASVKFKLSDSEWVENMSPYPIKKNFKKLLMEKGVDPDSANRIADKIIHYKREKLGYKIIRSLIKKEYSDAEDLFFGNRDWCLSSTSAYKAACEGDKIKAAREISKRAKLLRKKASEYFNLRWVEFNSLEEWHSAYMERARERAKAKKEQESICKLLPGNDCESLLRFLRVGDFYHIDGFRAKYGDNGVDVTEYSRYVKGFPFTSRTFTLKIKKGWRVTVIGGLITFYRGSIDRNGMACQWVRQGKAIADISTEKGFLVRGEHIKAKTLKEAQAISRERRAGVLARLLSSRKRVERRREAAENGTLKITFADSVASGNCRFGTSDFKHKYEEAIGHEAKSITLSDLRKYGKLFGVEYYAERVIRYVLAR